MSDVRDKGMPGIFTTSEPDSTIPATIFHSAILPCGLLVQNRLVKVAMYEHLASFAGGPPNEYHFRLYSEWAKYEWGMVVTGNVQIAQDHLTLGRDLVLPAFPFAEDLLQPFRRLAESIHGLYPTRATIPLKGNKTLAIMQLNHSGRQSSNFIGGRLPFQAPLAPSAIPVGSGSDKSLASTVVNLTMFQTPKAMTESDIVSVVDRFVDGAKLAHLTGFDGVQLHAAHGCRFCFSFNWHTLTVSLRVIDLLAQFLSEKANRRQDIYSSENALDMIRRIVWRIRESTAKDFAICIKLNAADYSFAKATMSESLSQGERRALDHLLTIASWGLVDVIEISGGDYEKPDFMTSSSESPRQAFFAHFSHQALQSLDSLRGVSQRPLPLILLTGGLRTPGLLRSALGLRHADLLGVGRGAVLCPDLPVLLRGRIDDPRRWDNVHFHCEPALQQPWILEYPPFNWMWSITPKIKLIGAGVTMAWYVVALRGIANTPFTSDSIKPNTGLGGLLSVFWMWFWTPLIGNRIPMPCQKYYLGWHILLVLTVVFVTYASEPYTILLWNRFNIPGLFRH
ncbi:hypothetical protein GALMADRAFT_235865 [Galerina marginata CBS 339.88]|uniref:NADH:flavin oxidoreductase/NADH oxidase N-terminal domain-containing protein n=1 Tax=Galerina marginata (strain CBS 339.88) TaxID=685588 RepID=A0A067TX50_GALM3|nr:hypothetical protein GALMADRAFT_235865 [Galerina marginata CBS 339.88]